MVILKGYDGNILIGTKKMSIDEFYDGDLDIIDDPDYLKKKRINKVIGVIYNKNLEIEPQFINRYDTDGNIVSSDNYDNSLTLVGSSRICLNYDSIIERYAYDISLSDDLLNIEFEMNYNPEYNINTYLIVCISNKDFELSDKETINTVDPKRENIFQKTTSEFNVGDAKSFMIKSIIDVYMEKTYIRRIVVTSGEIFCHSQLFE